MLPPWSSVLQTSKQDARLPRACCRLKLHAVRSLWCIILVAELHQADRKLNEQAVGRPLSCWHLPTLVPSANDIAGGNASKMCAAPDGHAHRTRHCSPYVWPWNAADMRTLLNCASVPQVCPSTLKSHRLQDWSRLGARLPPSSGFELGRPARGITRPCTTRRQVACARMGVGVRGCVRVAAMHACACRHRTVGVTALQLHNSLASTCLQCR